MINAPLSCYNPLSEHKPTAEVLKGFWDIVNCHIDAIDTKFASFAEMESNNWILEEKDSIKPQHHVALRY